MMKRTVTQWLMAGIMVVSLALNVHAAGAPAATDLDAAIKSGDFTGYLASLTDYINTQKLPSDTDSITQEKVKSILKDPALLAALSQRALITKVGAANLAAFAKADPLNKEFLAWVLGNIKTLDLYLEAATPTGLKHREENKWAIPVSSLEIWRDIYKADPESRDGMLLNLAIGAAINPPPALSSYSNVPITPLGRYTYFKTAEKNNELVPSFKKLTAWEYSKLMCNNGPTASDAEFTWGREMIKTFRPDFLIDEKVVDIVSMVWRRNSPVPYTGMQTMLQGGGKCGPRGAFGVFINQAFGIPAIGVGQPKHACVAHKTIDGAWRVSYGRGWVVSKLDGLTGPDFVEGYEARYRPDQFAMAEHMRWFASSLASTNQAGAVLAVAQKYALEKPAVVAKPAVAPAAPAKTVAAPPPAPVKAVEGVLTVDAAAFTKQQGEGMFGGYPGVIVMDSPSGGKQIYFGQQMKFCWAEYALDVPASGTYEVTMKASCVNEDQVLDVCSGTNVLATAAIPLNYGLWETTKPVDVKLEKGIQSVRIALPVNNPKRGIALKSFQLKPKGATSVVAKQ